MRSLRSDLRHRSTNLGFREVFWSVVGYELLTGGRKLDSGIGALKARMKKITVGSELTTHSVITYTGDEWNLLERIALETALMTYPEYLLRLRDWTTAVLTKAGRPTEDKMVHVAGNGTWEYVPDLSKFEHDGAAKLIRGLDYSQREEEESIAWYASQILRTVYSELEFLRPSAKPSSYSQTVAQSARRARQLALRPSAYQLGVLVERVRWKFRHEKAAIFGHAHEETRLSWQAAGATAQRRRGDETTSLIEPYFGEALEVIFRGRSPTRAELEQQKLSRIVRRIRLAGVKDKAVAGLSFSTLRRHIKKLLEARLSSTQD